MKWSPGAVNCCHWVIYTGVHFTTLGDSVYRYLKLPRKTEGRSRGGERMRWLEGITNSIVMSLNKLWAIVKSREACCVALHGVTKRRTGLSNWTTTLTVKTDEVFRNVVHEYIITKYQSENPGNVEVRITKLHPTNSTRALPKTAGR